MKQLSRKKIQDMIDLNGVNISSRRSSGGSGAGGGGGVSSAWVDEHYVSKDFFARLFTINGTDENDDEVVVEPNDLDTTITNIQAMVGLWTEEYLSALGQGSGGGGGGGALLTEPLASINEAGMGTPSSPNQVIVWTGSTWAYRPYTTGSGTVTSVALNVPTGFKVSGSNSQAITSSGTFALTFDTGYSLPTTAKQTDWDTAFTWVDTNGATVLDAAHTHSNKSVLDDITSTLVTHWNAAYTWVNTNGASTVSKTAWGRTYWNAGSPQNISGDIENAANIQIDNDKKISWKKAGASNYLSMLTLDSSNNFVIGESMASEGLTTYLRGRSITFQTGTGNSGNHSASLSSGGVLTVEKLVIGGITISHDTSNGGLHVESAGLYADTYLSALGAGSGGGSGSGITMADVWTAMEETAPNSSSEQIDASHLAIALGNYAQKSWVQGQGYVINIVGQGQSSPYPKSNGVVSLPAFLTSVPAASSSVLGGIKTGYPESGKNYAVQLNNNNEAFVNVPWENYTLPLADSDTLGGIQLGYPSVGKNYAVQTAAGKAFVNVPWENDDTKNTAGCEVYNSKKLYLTGTIGNSQTQSGYYEQTYVNTNCYIDSDNCLCSNGSKVLTSASGLVDTSTNQEVGGTKTFTSSIVLANNTTVSFKNTPTGTACNVLTLNASNNLMIGYGVGNTSNTYICGKTLQLAVHDATDASTIRSVFYASNDGDVGIGTTTPGYKLDVIGQLRFRKSTSATSECTMGTYSDTENPFIRFKDKNGDITDIRMSTVSSEGPVYGLFIGNNTKQTRIFGQNVRIYARTSATSDSYSPALVTMYGGRVTAGGVNSTLSNNNTDCQLVINGNACTTEDNNSFMQIGLVRLVYDSTDSALKAIKKDGTAAYLYSGGAKVLTSGNTVTTDTDQTISAAKIFSVGLMSKSICIETKIDGTADNSRAGEINRYGSDLKLQHHALTGYTAGGIVMCNNGGNVAIGSSSPNANYKLHVSGAGYFTGKVYSEGNEVLTSASGLVTTSTTQDISGSKTFTADIRCMKSNASIYVCQSQNGSEIKKVGLNSDTNRGVYDFTESKWLVGNNGTNTFLMMGSVGIGTTNPTAKLHVDGSGYFTSGLQIGGIDQYRTLYVNGTSRFSDSVGIAGYDANYKLYVNGNASINGMTITTDTPSMSSAVSSVKLSAPTGKGLWCYSNMVLYASGTWNSSSDVRKKDILERVEASVDQIAEASIFNYRMKADKSGNVSLGTSAQEWQKIFPTSVKIMPDGFLGFDYSSAALASSVMVAREIICLKKRVAELEKQLKAS